jgi:hypothetical protein
MEAATLQAPIYTQLRAISDDETMESLAGFSGNLANKRIGGREGGEEEEEEGK